MKPILIIGIGNSLLADEGVGVYVAQRLAARSDLPDDVEVLDGGTGGYNLLDVIGGRERLIVVDAVRGGGAPGTIYRFTPTDVPLESRFSMSLHEIGLPEILAAAELAGDAPKEVIILGVEPALVEWGLELSPEVAAVAPRAMELALQETRGQS